MTQTNGKRYGFKTGSWGITIVRLSDNATVFLQGDEEGELERQLGALDHIEYPFGPFSDYESHLDVVLDQYDSVMEVS
jgi:hypothetical protein